MLKSFVPNYDATVVRKLHEAGSLFIGKTNLDEFGMGSGSCDSYFGPVKNPWGFDEKRWKIAGGSSGGSAAAVASGVASIGLGSDTGGSTRNPASYNGVVGFKPTYMTLSRFGLISLVNSMDVPGILTRNVDLCAKVYNLLKFEDEQDSTNILTGYRDRNRKPFNLKKAVIGIPKEYFCHGLSDEIKKTWIHLADVLERHGAKVIDISLPNTLSSIFVYSILNQCEVVSNMARYDGLKYGLRKDIKKSTEAMYAKTRQVGFNAVVKNRILAGNFFLLKKNYEKYFVKALKVRRLISNDFEKAFNGLDSVDFILSPVTLTTAPSHLEFSKYKNRDQCALQDIFTQPSNMAGLPAISLPINISKDGLPISLQIIGPKYCEEELFQFSSWIETYFDFKKHYKLIS
ncbi:glutamyl-tRNA(Gln) amidotransferase subunit A, mitochondrial isoform X2 [Culicoides brevitarsis]